MNVLEQSTKQLRSRQYKLENSYISLQNDMVTIAQVTAEQFEQYKGELNTTKQALLTLANRTEEKIKEIVTQYRQYDYVTTLSIQTLAKLSSQAIYLVELADQHYNDLSWYLANYRAGLVDLLQGKLPSTLVPPHLLLKILTETSEKMYQILPQYELVFKSVANYYRQTDIAYSIVDDHLLVLIPLLMKKTNQAPLDLYRIETCYVPYDMSTHAQNQPRSYTKVDLNAEFIAIGNNNFAEISLAQLSSCVLYSDLYLCEQYILQLHKSAITCASALYWNTNAQVIAQNCEFRYIHKFTPPPCLLESEKNVLLANMGDTWQFRCSSQNVPKRIKGSDFAVIPRSSFCNCALVGTTYFVPERLGDCEGEAPNIELRYPINAMVASVFYTQVKPTTLLHNLSQLYKEPPKWNIPQLNISFSESEQNVLLGSSLTKEVDLKRIAKALETRKQLYLDRQDKAEQDKKLETWFNDMDNIAIAATFVLSLVGTMAAILAIYNCIKNHRIAALFGSLLAQPGPAQATEMLPSECDISPTGILKEKFLQVLIVLMLYAAYCFAKRLYCRWSIIKVAIPEAIASHKGTISHIHLEFACPTKGITKVYLCSLYTPVIGLRLLGQLTLTDITLTLNRFKIYAILTIDWTRSSFIILHDNIPITLPSVAYVNAWTYRKLQPILSEKFTVRAILTYDGLCYVLPSFHDDGTTKTTPHASKDETINEKGSKSHKKSKSRTSIHLNPAAKVIHPNYLTMSSPRCPLIDRSLVSPPESPDKPSSLTEIIEEEERKPQVVAQSYVEMSYPYSLPTQLTYDSEELTLNQIMPPISTDSMRN